MYHDINKYVDLIKFKDNFIDRNYGLIYGTMDWGEETTEEEVEIESLLWARIDYIKHLYIQTGCYDYDEIITKHFGTEFDEAIEGFKMNIKGDLDFEMGI